jgi:hypothetical protein
MRHHVDGLRVNFEQAGKELEDARLEILARNQRIADLEARLAASERERQQLVDALQLEVARSQSALREYRADSVRSAPSSDASVVEQQTSSPRNTNYLLLVPDGAGSHSLRACSGAPPAVGAEMAIGGQPFVAVSHRRSPIDADERVCVQLEAR